VRFKNNGDVDNQLLKLVQNALQTLEAATRGSVS
jgi:hypothetical protein